MGWREEFPDMATELPDGIAAQVEVLLKAGFTDQSWKNDECPSFHRMRDNIHEVVWLDDVGAISRGTWLYSYTRRYAGTDITIVDAGTHEWSVIKLLTGI